MHEIWRRNVDYGHAALGAADAHHRAGFAVPRVSSKAAFAQQLSAAEGRCRLGSSNKRNEYPAAVYTWHKWRGPKYALRGQAKWRSTLIEC